MKMAGGRIVGKMYVAHDNGSGMLFAPGVMFFIPLDQDVKKMEKDLKCELLKLGPEGDNYSIPDKDYKAPDDKKKK